MGDLNPGEMIAGVTRRIAQGPKFEILIVGVGMNDLLEGNCDNNIAKKAWPPNLDEDLADLAKAIREKSEKNLILVGGPSDVWGYPTHWDAFVVRACDILQQAGAQPLPPEQVAHVTRQMKVSHDKLHFSHDE